MFFAPLFSDEWNLLLLFVLNAAAKRKGLTIPSKYLSLSLSLSLYFSLLSLSISLFPLYTQTHTHAHSLSLSLPFPLSHTHTHSQAQFASSLSLSLYLSRSLSKVSIRHHRKSTFSTFETFLQSYLSLKKLNLKSQPIDGANFHSILSFVFKNLNLNKCKTGSKWKLIKYKNKILLLFLGFRQVKKIKYVVSIPSFNRSMWNVEHLRQWFSTFINWQHSKLQKLFMAPHHNKYNRT